jgi:hypothetical protein
VRDGEMEERASRAACKSKEQVCGDCEARADLHPLLPEEPADGWGAGMGLRYSQRLRPCAHLHFSLHNCRTRRPSPQRVIS